jgi:hypothetical protein
MKTATGARHGAVNTLDKRGIHSHGAYNVKVAALKNVKKRAHKYVSEDGEWFRRLGRL